MVFRRADFFFGHSRVMVMAGCHKNSDAGSGRLPVIIGFEFFISLRDRLIDIFVEFHSLEFRVCAHVAVFLPQ